MQNKLGPETTVIPENYISSDSNNESTVPNPFLQQLRTSTRTLYLILLVTAPLYLVTYSILWSQIQSTLDLFETGNAWTFILFLVTCSIVTLLSLTIIIQIKLKFPLRWKHVFGLDLILICCWASLFMVMLGVVEHCQDRSRCGDPGVKCTKRSAPKIPTMFGIYIAGVCGTNLTGIHSEPLPNLLEQDDEKCEATKLLKIEILTMYIWTIELMVISILEIVLGVGNCRGRNAPEFLHISST